MHWLGDFWSLGRYWISPFRNRPQDIKSLGTNKAVPLPHLAPLPFAPSWMLKACNQSVRPSLCGLINKARSIELTLALLNLSTPVMEVSMPNLLPNTDLIDQWNTVRTNQVSLTALNSASNITAQARYAAVIIKQVKMTCLHYRPQSSAPLPFAVAPKGN